MKIDTFVCAPHVPRDIFDDKELLYGVLLAEWEHRLRESGGIRLPGPLCMKIMQYGLIDDDSLEPVIFDKDFVRIQFVVVRITGPVMAP